MIAPIVRGFKADLADSDKHGRFFFGPRFKTKRRQLVSFWTSGALRAPLTGRNSGTSRALGLPSVGFLRCLCFGALVLASLTLVSCGSGSTSLTEPTDARCAVSLNLDPGSFGAQGGKGTAAVLVDRECQWSASTTGSWLTLSNPTSGQGPGSLTLNAAPNRSLAVRSADLIVSGQKATISQSAATCSLTATTSSSTVGPAASEVRIAIVTDDFCTWKAVSQSSWIVLGAVAEGTGPMEIVAAVAANSEGQRVGAIEIGGTVIQITQRGAQPGCEVTIAPASGATPSSGGTLTVEITAAAACPWTVTNENSWITATPARGTGAGSVRIVTEPNGGPARSGIVTIGSNAFSVAQAAPSSPTPPPPVPCAYSLDAASASVGPTAGSRTVNVTTLSTCSWTAQTSLEWVHVSGATQSGSGAIVLDYDANTGSARTGVVTIAGLSFSLTQQSGCTYAIAPTSQNVAAGGSDVTVNVKTGAGCAWSVDGEPSWVTAAPDASQGTGSTVLTVDANTSLARSSTFTIAGQSFTVNQAIGLVCTYSVSPQSLDVSSNSQTRTITVTTQADCPVNASESVNWLSIESVGDAPSAVITLEFEEHGGKNDRTTTVTITGLNYTRDVQVRQRHD